MMPELFESTSTKVFAFIITAVFLIAISLDKGGKRKRFIQYAPTLMTSLGILGTFWGIVIGLLSFDTVNIDHSIPNLLSGLKTAFVTSIFGMLASIIFNALDSWRFSDDQNKKNAEQQMIQNSILMQTELLSEIKNALADQEEHSLASQLKIMRKDFHEHRKEFDSMLWSQLNDFSDKVSKSATKRITEALRCIVTDFNNQLFEQFGDNFKALDSSVKKLVDWQEDYIEQLVLMDSQFKQSVESITSISEAVIVIGEHCNHIPQTMVSLQSIIQTNQNQLEELERHLEAFVLMRDHAITAVPLLQEGIEGIGSLITTSNDSLQEVFDHSAQHLLTNIESMNKTMDANIQRMNDSIQNGMSLLEQMGERLVQNNNKMCFTMESSVKKISDELLSSNERIRVSMEQGINNITDEIVCSNNKIRSTMDKEIDAISDDLSLVNKNMRSYMESYYNELQITTEKSIESFNEIINKNRCALEQSTEHEINAGIELMRSTLKKINEGIVNSYDWMKKEHEEMMSKTDVEIIDIES